MTVMKKAISIVLLAIGMHFTTYSQTCLPDGITFSTQDQIDNFQSDYPGCTEIIGSVYIEGSDIQNLDGLNVLISIPSFLSIGSYYEGNPMLTSIQGLENLTEIGAIAIRNNVSLASLSGLQGISNTGSIFIENNASLKEVTGYGLYLKNGAQITYESGLASTTNFASGPGGSWKFKKDSWQEIKE